VTELTGAPLSVPLMGSNLTKDVDLAVGPVEKSMSDESTCAATFK